MLNKGQSQKQTHGFGPLFDSESRILILGSFPSTRSREEGFFYGHPQNRFWAVLSAIYGEDKPLSIEEKTTFILSHHLALYDVIESCSIINSSDVSIKDVEPADILSIIKHSKIKKILLNGKTAEKYFHLYQKVNSSIDVLVLPSTSPANAAAKLDALISIWSKALRE